MDIITVDDLASYLRDDAVTHDTASLLVELANGVVSEVYTGTTPTVRVRAITLEVAARAYRNPQGYSSETIDDYTYRRDTETRQAGVYLTDGERAELRGSSTATSGAFTIKPAALPRLSPYDAR